MPSIVETIAIIDQQLIASARVERGLYGEYNAQDTVVPILN